MRSNDRELPAFTWDGEYWTAMVKLPFWSKLVKQADRGFVRVEVTPPAASDERVSPPSEEQRAAIADLIEDQQKSGEVVLKALFAQHARASRDERPRQPLEDIAGLRKHATLTHVNVLAVAKQKRAYLGFSFGCSWDGEHGAGVMIHKRRRVTDGGADHAFLGWLAKRDGGAALNAASPDREPRAGAKASLTPSTKAKPKPKPSTKPKTTSAKPKTSTGAKRKPRAKAKRSS